MNPYLIAVDPAGDHTMPDAHPAMQQAAPHETGGSGEAHSPTASGDHGAAAAGHAAESHGSGISIGEHWKVDTAYGAVNVDTVGASVIVMIVLLIIFAALGRTINPVPSEKSGAVGTVLEGVVEFCQKIIRDFIGYKTSPYLWYVGSIFVFILFANWISLLPWHAWELTAGHALQASLNAPHAVSYHAPTADLNLTAALALISLVMYWFFGIKHNGIGKFLGHHWFAKPIGLFPLRMMEDLTRPVSLALRLFANMTAGHVVGLVLLMLVPFVIPAVMLPLELFIGAVQAFIFATLSASYIGAAMADDHH